MERTFISTGERIRNYLGIALLLSLMLNALVTPLYPDLTRHNIHDDRPDIFFITHPTTVKTPLPTPPPTPKPRQKQSHPTTQAPPILRPPITTATTGPAASPYVVPSGAVIGGIPVDSPGIGPTAGATTGTETVGPLCSNPNVDASVSSPVSPTYPDSARDFALGTVTVLVAVTIDAQGRLVDAKIATSSGNAAIDQAALRAARQTTYAPRIANCVPVEGTYIFHADFSPN